MMRSPTCGSLGWRRRVLFAALAIASELEVALWFGQILDCFEGPDVLGDVDIGEGGLGVVDEEPPCVLDALVSN